MPQPPKPQGWTEQEAKNLMECPHCMLMGVHFDDGQSAHCIGSDCMGWRWVKNSTDHGYCGAAGLLT